MSTLCRVCVCLQNDCDVTNIFSVGENGAVSNMLIEYASVEVCINT